MSPASAAGLPCMTEPQTHTLETRGAVLTYDVRPGSSAAPPLLLIGSPMGAAGFGTLAAHFRDRTVVTYDPRGLGRSPRRDGRVDHTPEGQAADLHALIGALGAGPVDVFASSGGAVTALALVAAHPDDVRTLVAHEPPVIPVLPDAEAAARARAGFTEAYRAEGASAGMAAFLAMTSWKGEFTDDYFAQPAPDPAAYPTGAEWVRDYLQPLADALGDRVRVDARVVGVARRGWDRVADAGRATEPLTVRLHTGERITARAVIDASGTWTVPNPLGGDGLPALGEEAAADRVSHRVPDLADPAVRARYAGRRTAVAGSGHSALTALAELAALADEEPGTEIVWVLRRGGVGNAFGGGTADELPARGALGQRAARAVAAGRVTTVPSFRTAVISNRRPTTGPSPVTRLTFTPAAEEA